MKARLKSAWRLLKDSGVEWNRNEAMRLSAALSYYTVFALAPLLLLATAVAGLAFGQDAVRGELTKQLAFLLGEPGAKAVNGLVASARQPAQGILATVVSGVALLIGATGVFVELKADLNLLWDAKPTEGSGLWLFIRDRLLSFAMVASLGFVLLVSLLVNTGLSIASHYLPGALQVSVYLLQSLYTLVSVAMTTLVFALIFKFLPDKQIRWRDVWMGAAVTAILFSVGRVVIGLYLGSTTVLSAFGASASVVIILIWTYYSSLILFYGAQFTVVHARASRSEKPRRVRAA